MPRAHCYRPVLDPNGNVLSDLVVRIYEPGTSTLISEPVYLGPTEPTGADQPIPFTNGVINFYLDDPKRVRIGVRKGVNPEQYFEDVDVVLPGSPTAASVSFSPSGDYSATNVQTALEEVGLDLSALQTDFNAQDAVLWAGDWLAGTPYPINSLVFRDPLLVIAPKDIAADKDPLGLYGEVVEVVTTTGNRVLGTNALHQQFVLSADIEIDTLAVWTDGTIYPLLNISDTRGGAPLVIDGVTVEAEVTEMPASPPGWIYAHLTDSVTIPAGTYWFHSEAQDGYNTTDGDLLAPGAFSGYAYDLTGTIIPGEYMVFALLWTTVSPWKIIASLDRPRFFSLQTIVTGDLVVADHVVKPGLRVPETATATAFVVRLDTPAVGADVHITATRWNNGVYAEDIGTVVLPAGEWIASVTGLSVDCAKGDIIRFNVTQIGSTSPGTDLSLSVDFQ